MSRICIGCALITVEERGWYCKKINDIAQTYGRGVFFELVWDEPILHFVQNNAFVFSLADDNRWDNCEMLLLPDNWYFNEQTNIQPFSERIQYVCEVADVFASSGKQLEFYIGLSGTHPDEYETLEVCCDNLGTILSNTVGKNGDDNSLHIIVL